MTYRRDIVVLHPTDTPEEVLRIIHEEHFSKYLLVERGKDEIIGVVSVKDIILMMGGEQPFNLRSIARPALFIPESLYAKKVLELFKKNKNKFGVVVDEYGNTEGIITLHDLTESIFGDILEENETEEEEIVVRQDGSMLVEASMNLDDFMEAMGIMNYDDLKEEDFTTLSGLAMFLDRTGAESRRLVQLQNLDFEVVDMDRGRVDKLLAQSRKKKMNNKRYCVFINLNLKPLKQMKKSNDDCSDCRCIGILPIKRKSKQQHHGRRRNDCCRQRFFACSRL